MSSLPAGPLFGDARYRVIGPAGPGGAFQLHEAVLRIDALSADGGESEVPVLVKTIDYDRAFDPLGGEPFPDFVRRRRADLLREADHLASYKKRTAHLPQIVDCVRGENTWSRSIASEGLTEGETCLIHDRIEARRLSSLLTEEMSQEETLFMAEKLLRLLRVFHAKNPHTGAPRFFLSLSPPDVLVDRATRTYWLDNLWKLTTKEELGASGVHCFPVEMACVSAVIGRRLKPRSAPAVDPFPGMKMADLDLYSLGVVLFAVLEDADRLDLSSEPLGFLTGARVEDLARRRSLVPEFADFLTGLAEHRFHGTWAALAAVWKCLNRGTPPNLYEPEDPALKVLEGEDRLPDRTQVGDRYVVEGGHSRGGQGCVYIGRDLRTKSRVIVKVPSYAFCHEEDAPPLDLEAVRRKRAEGILEARRLLHLHARSGAVPALLDVVPVEIPEPLVRQHAEEEVRTGLESAVVLESIAGRPLGSDLGATVKLQPQELLSMARSLCAVAAALHARDASGCRYLYVDWKPQNILWHDESESFSLVDLGAVLRIEKDDSCDGQTYATSPYDAPETAFKDEVLNPAFDVYGISAVLWQLAVDPPIDTFTRLREEREQHYENQRRVSVFDASLVPDRHAKLRPILECGLSPLAKDRYQDAGAMLVAVEKALGETSKLPPDPPPCFNAVLSDMRGVEVSYRWPPDKFCSQVRVFRRKTAADARKKPIHTVDAGSAQPGEEIRFRDQPPVDWTHAEYMAVSVGLNGLESAPRQVGLDLIVDPEDVEIEREELGLRLRWTIPDVVRKIQGKIVVERLSPEPAEIYAGDGTEFLDDGLTPGTPHRYRVFARLPTGKSPGVERSAVPLPVLAQIPSIAVEPGDRQLVVHFTMTPGAASRLTFLRSGRPLGEQDIEEALGRAAPSALGFDMDAGFRITGIQSHSSASIEVGEGGTLNGTWVAEKAPPGRELVITPVLVFEDRSWRGAEGRGTAFVEVQDLDALPLPRAVRLLFTAPEGAEEIEVAKDGVRLCSLPPENSAYLDRGLPPGTRSDYRVRLRAGSVWSPGRTVTGAPASTGKLLPGSGDGSEGLRVAADPVGGGTALDLQLRPGGRLQAAWREPPGARGALVLLDGAPAARVVPPGVGHCSLGSVPPGEYGAQLFLIGESGAVSRAAHSNRLSVADPAGRVSP